VVERARAVGKPVVVAENFRFVPAERTLRKLVREGFLGAVSNATLVDRRRMPSDTQGSWMATLRYPQLQEIAVHHFDSLRSFFGEPESVVARVWNPPGSYAHGSSSEALIAMERGVHVQYLGTLTSHKFAWRLAVEGEAGLLWSDRKRVWWRARGKKLFRPLRNVPVPKGDGDPYPKEGTTSLLNAFRDACLHGTAAETRGEDNLRTIALVQAAKTSDREGRVVRVDEILPGP
jgi:predicted dehydrogenase